MQAPFRKGNDGSASVRVFYALWPDAPARDALARLARDVAARAGGRAPAAENIHLTLAFVGEVAADRVAALCAAGAEAATGVAAFDLALDRVGAFRGSGIAWAGASGVPPALLELAVRLNDRLAAGGFPIDTRPFHAHVTLARRCRRAPEAQIAAPIAWTVTRLVLNASDLGSGGPHYREIGAWQLGPAAAGR